MTPDQLTTWAVANPWPAAILATATLATTALTTWGGILAIRAVRFPPAAVLVAAAGALVCTTYSADASWRFAEHHLDMTALTERLVMFAAAELALLACAVMARANKKATTTDDQAGTPGVPGVLMWVITGVLVIPCYAESGPIGGTVRAVIGPVMAGLLWHLAMGLEIRVVRPEALSTGLPAMIGRELRERLLSRLGMATRNRTAEQITRDRATARAVRLGARRWLGPWGRARLAAALARSGAATNGEQRHTLMQQLAGRRSAGELRTVPVVSPWVQPPVPEAYPRTPLGVTGEQLRRMDPIEAIRCVHRAHPAAGPAELATLCTEYGVPVTEAQAGLALRAGQWGAGPVIDPSAPDRPELSPVPEPVPDAVPAPSPAGTLDLDLADMPEVHPEVRAPEPVLAADRTRTQVHARVPDEPVHEPSEDPLAFIQRRARGEHESASRAPGSTAVPAELLARARVLDAEYRRTHDGRPISIRALKAGLRVGQPRAEQVRDALAERTTS
ncbi:hypothetical protein DCW30_05780 [Streptomyces alfalfae]|uniref:DUF2637 domain-containing protein n=1 Tax=Streptomyces alfalfae TaxID=1642299 RepID=A0ABM6GWX9_9ACTN|nr:hypothetical protein [Streptomyces alfalfae]APY88189.1 hypothetical protein A7J05_23090 [Streptomyces alfalfae]AYA18585.1 hypothetical protein D3X13_22205 [Streptomyces fradiae]RXX46534.1 hypothetical protein DCW30_05780 [Streptomyces alfalfae]RZM90047.1 hypothetical protein D4104_25715 [Streptomyces alfalfae]